MPATSIGPAEAHERLGWIGGFVALDVPSSSARTRELLGWEPNGPTLLDDLAGDSYFAAPAAAWSGVVSGPPALAGGAAGVATAPASSSS